MSDARRHAEETAAPGSRTLRREQRHARAAAAPEVVAPARRKKSKRAASTSGAQDAEGPQEFQQLQQQAPQQFFQGGPQQPQQFQQGLQQFPVGQQQFQPMFQPIPQQLYQPMPQYGAGFSQDLLQQAAQLLQQQQQQQFTQVLSQQVFQRTQTSFGSPLPAYGPTQFVAPSISQQHFYQQQQQTLYPQPTPHASGMPRYSVPLDYGSQTGPSSSSTAAGPSQLTPIGHSAAQSAHEERRDQDSAGQHDDGGDEEEEQQEGGDDESPPRRRTGTRGFMRYRPLLTHSLPGGPEDPSILIGFEAHVAYDIYNNVERPPLRFLNRSTMLDGWRPSERQRWGHVVLNSAFGHIRSLLNDVIDYPLITAFIERWQPETNTFHLPSCEMTVTLHDVYQIMQLQIRGRSMAYSPQLVRLGSFQARQDALVNNACTEFNLSDASALGSGTVPWSEFKRLITTKDNGYSTSDKAVAYLVFLMSAALFPDKTGDKVDLRYVIYLDTLQKLEETAWGTGLLCHLYRSLGECSRADCRQAAFCFTLLQTWIYAHFPCFRPLERESWFNPVPYAQRWHHGEGGPTTSLTSYRLALDRLNIEQASI